ncbi:MAG: hypothetical protein AAF191_12800 [Verrucomicrobiota bacterium]
MTFKSVMTGLALLIATLIFLPQDASAHHSKRVGTCGQCGKSVYAYYTKVGYQSCGRPVYRYITKPCRHRSSSYSYRPSYYGGYNNSCGPRYYGGSGFSISIRR